MDYYKFTNKKEKHNGLQYHDGLNIDVLPFNPKGDCEPVVFILLKKTYSLF